MPTPLEVYNKRIKKREKEKRKNERAEARNIAKLLQEPEKLKQELDELSHKAIIGRIDQESLQRKEKLEKIWSQHKSTPKYAPEPVPVPATESSETSSDSSEYSDDSPRCVIEIAGQPKGGIKRGFHDPDPTDNIALELLANVPSLPVPPEGMPSSEPPGPPGPPPPIPGKTHGAPEKQMDNKRPKFAHGRPGMHNSGKRGGMARPGGSRPPPPPPVGATHSQAQRGQWESLGRGQHLEMRVPPPPPSHGPAGYGNQSGSSKTDSSTEKPTVPIKQYFIPTQLR
ncbi:hypothetical protein BEWA_030450 [Theileria equi strain WA]|uniref:Wbp11/ELF5/Saf1 N-terminal domain-containing protein n=1 Tax=Theileria equi strain WA TaxID=1537102 RepID=L0AX80_THEEQ|nr:hypothetical protein BEWA_030450 [Theileria equi strain WA]AFZ80192.1 hypothetical protein BEWA_030450 [Theileria equi strain WA]|eukprot:XP_004829858.1 hypothetical protein BEWA_030450 [Theileria equi strain WA]